MKLCKAQKWQFIEFLLKPTEPYFELSEYFGLCIFGLVNTSNNLAMFFNLSPKISIWNRRPQKACKVGLVLLNFGNEKKGS